MSEISIKTPFNLIKYHYSLLFLQKKDKEKEKSDKKKIINVKVCRNYATFCKSNKMFQTSE